MVANKITALYVELNQRKDQVEALNLVRIHYLDTAAPEFQKILDRYATPSIKERLLSELRRPV